LVSNSDDAFELKNMLCVPIMDSDGHVIGVSQVMNKLNGRIFTEDDVAIIEVRIYSRRRKMFFFCLGFFGFLWFRYS
jgi:hypothetical protein